MWHYNISGFNTKKLIFYESKSLLSIFPIQKSIIFVIMVFTLTKQRPIIRTIKWPLYHSKVIKQMITELSWRNKILKFFNYDILMCDRCGKTLILVPDMCFIPKRLKRKRCYG